MLDTIINSLKELLSNPGVVLIGAVTLIEIVPVQIHPWKWITNLLLGDIRKDISDLRAEVTETKVNTWRWNVLDFANSCRNGRRHSHDEWRHTMSQLAEYEAYIERNKIPNGVFEEDAKYLRNLYQRLSDENDFLL